MRRYDRLVRRAAGSILVSMPMVLDPWLVMPILAISMAFVALAIVSAPPDRSRLR